MPRQTERSQAEAEAQALLAIDPTTYMAEYEGMPISAGPTLEIPTAGGATVPALQPTRSSIMRQMAYHPATRRVAGSVVKHVKAHTLRYFQRTGECCSCGQQGLPYPQQQPGQLPPGFQSVSPNSDQPFLKPFEQPQTPCSPTMDALQRAGIDPNCLRQLVRPMARPARRRATRGRRRTLRRAGARRSLPRRRRVRRRVGSNLPLTAQQRENLRIPPSTRAMDRAIYGGTRRRRHRRTAATRRRSPARRRRVTERSQGVMTRAEFLQMGRDMGVF